MHMNAGGMQEIFFWRPHGLGIYWFSYTYINFQTGDSYHFRYMGYILWIYCNQQFQLSFHLYAGGWRGMQGHAEELRGIQENTGVCRGMHWGQASSRQRRLYQTKADYSRPNYSEIRGATGWSKATVTHNISLTHLKITKKGITQWFLESLYPAIFIFQCLSMVKWKQTWLFGDVPK